MITITKINENKSFEFAGLAADIKPIGKESVNSNVDYEIPNGSVLFTMDDKQAYMYKLVKSSNTKPYYTGSWVTL